MHVVDEVQMIHHVHLGHKLLLDDLGHGDGVFIVSSHLEILALIYHHRLKHLCDPLGGPLAQRPEKVLLESVVDILGDLVTLGADVDSRGLVPILGTGDLPSINWSHHFIYVDMKCNAKCYL